MKEIFMRLLFIVIVFSVGYGLDLINVKHTKSGIKSKKYSIVMTMIIRDEEINLKSNLALWLSIVDYFVFLVDTRTIDNSINAIETILNNSTSQYKILPNEFDGFGSSRTRSLKAAWENFPQATHVWISDPDWRPDISTININDLDLEYDVFAFKSFDRTGITTRIMHWLLKHREGLKMRYNIHEVLDIGDYNWKTTNWVIHEVEQVGTWHSTVGHGNSMSKNRYLFDIKLLEKDLIEYGHDFHTHNYLGVTHEAIAGILFRENKHINDEVSYHLNLAIKYLELRSLSIYSREYLEDRVNCMMMLGNIYAYYLENFNKAEYWYHMCYEFNPKLTDCGILLAKLFLQFGVLENAVSLTSTLIKTEKHDKVGINLYKNWDCDLPRLANQIYGYRLLSNKASMQNTEIKYMILLDKMVNTNANCRNTSETHLSSSFSKNVRTAMLESIRGQDFSLRSSIAYLCSDQELGQYINTNDIKLHPCENLSQSVKTSQVCRDFMMDFPPINEELQLKNEKSFIGAMSIHDIVHQIFLGSFYQSFHAIKKPYRILLAEFFNLKVVYRLMGFSIRHPNLKFDVTIISPSPEIESNIKSAQLTCGVTLGSNFRLGYIFATLNDYITSFTSSDLKSSNKRNTIKTFNYIEYNGGMTRHDHYNKHLDAFRNYLLDEISGVIGLTYFTKNSYQQKLFDLILKQNNSVDELYNNISEIHIPFSNHREYLIKNYLKLYDLDFFLSDSQFVDFFGARDNDYHYKFYSNHSPTKPQTNSSGQVSLEFIDKSLGTPFSQREMEEIIHRNGLSIQAWLPTAFSHPYDEITTKDVLQYRSFGIHQSDFVESIMPTFRFSLYITRNDSTVPGRANINKMYSNKLSNMEIEYIRNNLVNEIRNESAVNIVDVLEVSNLKQLRIVDRIGTLGLSFQQSPELSKQGFSTQFAIGHYSLANSKLKLMSFRDIVHPLVATALPLLSSKPTLYQLLNASMFTQFEKLRLDEFQVQMQKQKFSKAKLNSQVNTRLLVDEIDVNRLYKLLLDMLRFLESMNYITLSSEVDTYASSQAEDFVKKVNNSVSNISSHLDLKSQKVAGDDKLETGEFGSVSISLDVKATASPLDEDIDSSQVKSIDAINIAEINTDKNSVKVINSAHFLKYELTSTQQKKIQRMRDLGFPDSVVEKAIQDILAKSRNKFEDSSKRSATIEQVELNEVQSDQSRTLDISGITIDNDNFDNQIRFDENEFSSRKKDTSTSKVAPGNVETSSIDCEFNSRDSITVKNESLVPNISRVDAVTAAAVAVKKHKVKLSSSSESDKYDSKNRSSYGHLSTDRTQQAAESVVKTLINKLQLADESYQKLLSESDAVKQLYSGNNTTLSFNFSSMNETEDRAVTEVVSDEEDAAKLQATINIEYLINKASSLTTLLESLQDIVDTNSSTDSNKETQINDVSSARKSTLNLKEAGLNLNEEVSNYDSQYDCDDEDQIKSSLADYTLSDDLLPTERKVMSMEDQIDNSILTEELEVKSTKILAEAEKILVITGIQTEDQLHLSYRGHHCIDSSIDIYKNDCPSFPSAAIAKRKTASILTTSLSKLNFDISQLEYVLKVVSLSRNIKIKLLSYHRELTDIYSNLISSSSMKSAKNGIVRLTPLEIQNLTPNGVSVMNHVMHISVMNSSLHNGNSSICFLQALTHISQTLEQLQASDFIVVDVLVKPKVLTSLTSWLMTSTVWFDSNNGESWASYNDDGLIHPDFASLAKELASSLSQGPIKYSVKSYFVLASRVSRSASPIMMVLWLNQLAIEFDDDDTQLPQDLDGLHIFESSTTSALYTKGISIYPSFHPNYLSIKSGLNIDMYELFSSKSSEVVLRHANRVVFINSHVPFFIQTNVNEERVDEESLEKATSLVFIVQLTSKRSKGA